MARGTYKQIEYLPNGWVNVPKGAETWTYSKKVSDKDSNGKAIRGHTHTVNVNSDERHAKNLLTGETMSVRQYQKIQAVNRETSGQPPPVPIPRRGLIRTQYNVQTSTKGGFFSYALHGQQAVYSFRSIDEARLWTAQGGAGERFNVFLLQIRYTERLTNARKPNSDTRMKNGYATLTGFTERDLFELSAGFNGPVMRGRVTNIWDDAEEQIATDFDMSGDKARVYIWAGER